MKPALRETLVDSQISAVAIAVLLIWSFDAGFRALWGPLSRVATFLFTAVAILDIPSFSLADAANRFRWQVTFLYLLNSIITFAAAWFLSRCVYGVGPFRSLGICRNKLIRSNHA